MKFLFFTVVALIKLVLVLMGLLIIPVLSIFRVYKTSISIRDGRPIKVFPKLFWIWSNDEDGIIEGIEFLDKPDWFRIIYWSAIRNPANNLRYVNFISPKPDSSKVRFKLKTPTGIIDQNFLDHKMIPLLEEGKISPSFSYSATQGIYWNYRKEYKLFGSYRRLWIGYKIYPSSIFMIHDYQKNGIGITLRLAQRVR